MSDQSKLTYYIYCLTFELQKNYIDLYVNPVKISIGYSSYITIVCKINVSER